MCDSYLLFFFCELYHKVALYNLALKRMEPRRRSARLQAIHNAVSNEEAAVVAKATDPTVSFNYN